VLRRATTKDAEEILLTRIASIRALASSHYSQTEIDDWCKTRSAASYHSPIEEKVVLVEEVDGQVVGFGQLDPTGAVIEAVYVCPTTTRHGIGIKILRALEAAAAAQGIQELTLEASLNAIEFYRRAGYVPDLQSTHESVRGNSGSTVAMRRHLFNEPET
jgi:putative acetyltransferase